MYDIPQVAYWPIGNQEWRLQISFCSQQKEILKFFKDWKPVGQGIDSTDKKDIIIFSKKFENDLELMIFILDLEKKYEVLIKEV